MTISRFYSIPRFALPYTFSDFAAGLRDTTAGGPPAAAFPLFPGVPKYWTRSGRQALCRLLRALRLKPLAGVAIPLFTDPSLVHAIVAAGLRPVFIDINPRSLTMSPQSLADRRDDFSAVVAVHLFGQTADMPALMEAAEDAAVIEDAAHAPFSFLDGRMAGTFGEAAFYSFASTKYWPAGGGGLAVVNDPLLTESVTEEFRQLAPPSRVEEWQKLALLAAKAAVFHRRLYGICGRPVHHWADRWALLEPRLDESGIQSSWAVVACRQAIVLPERVERQRANSLQLLAHLGTPDDVVLPREAPSARYNYHLFPVLLRNEAERTAMTTAMWSRFVDTSTIYSNTIREARKFGYRGGCPVAESVATRLVTLPNYASLCASDIEAVAEVFLSSLNGYRRAAGKLYCTV